jgi:predicted Fe-Mo cluster-binding NifX family protein
MKICIPVLEDLGRNSPVCGHFGSAPLFLLVDTVSDTFQPLVNRTHEGGGGCNPLRSIEGAGVDAMLVGGIGGGPLMRLQAAGIRVMRAEGATVAEAIAALAHGAADMDEPSCGHHDHGEGHGGGGCHHQN